MLHSWFVTRRTALTGLAAPLLGLLAPPSARANGDARQFINEAFRMRDDAIAAGDQPYGAVIIVDGRVAGYGPSRVITGNNNDAHAERVALWDAQKRLGGDKLPGAVIYSTSTPCMICQPALAKAGIVRMFVGERGVDAGPPKEGVRRTGGGKS